MSNPHLMMVLLIGLLIGACGTSRGVSVVSHGKKDFPDHPQKETVIEQPEKAISALPPPEPPMVSEVVPSTIPLQEASLAPPSGAETGPTQNHQTAPVTSAPPAGTSEIFAQSAYSSSLPMNLGDVFFDYDQMTIRPEAMDILEQNAKIVMARFPDRKIVIEGHCDERGTEEYNLILGKRRAKAVKEFLEDLGVPASNMTIISYGKTKPFCQTRTPHCLQQNRRAHFVLQ